MKLIPSCGSEAGKVMVIGSKSTTNDESATPSSRERGSTVIPKVRFARGIWVSLSLLIGTVSQHINSADPSEVIASHGEMSGLEETSIFSTTLYWDPSSVASSKTLNSCSRFPRLISKALAM